jgi:tRNA (adenine22-N1)-methyltransferase
MIPSGARVADIGADHGYLGIYLLQTGVASFVTASDVREQPLDSARANAARFGMTERMDLSSATDCPA